MPMRYVAVSLPETPSADAGWDEAPWNSIEELSIAHFMGKRPKHFPNAAAKLAYDGEAVYVAFRVEDRYVRAVTENHQDAVCRDSCVEFFFAPGADTEVGYFNLEMNCGGAMLFHFQTTPRVDAAPVTPGDIEKIETKHSMPRIVDPEIAEPVIWTVSYRMPFAILKNYRQVAVPAPGVTWRANFYKCADLCSHPHWLTWSPVDLPRPDFHRPDFFGMLEFA